MNHKPDEDQVLDQEVIPSDISIEEAKNQTGDLVSDIDDAEKTQEQPFSSVQADTHASKRSKKNRLNIKERKIIKDKKWSSIVGLAAGGVALVALLVSGILSQYFKNKVMPGVLVAGNAISAKSESDVRQQLEHKIADFNVTLRHEEIAVQPKNEEIGLEIDLDKTVQNVMNAKRTNGFMDRVMFWKKVNVPLVVQVDDSLLSQYAEAQFAKLQKPPQDSHLEFDAAKNSFVITKQADGQGVDTTDLKNAIVDSAANIQSSEIKPKITTKTPKITEANLEKLLAEANQIVARNVVLSGLGTTFRARPADIAAWVTPTPQKDGVLRLVIDPAKVQGYVDSIGKRISNEPQDRKVLKDSNTGQEVVIQEGRAGTELEGSVQLAESITKALRSGQDTSQIMSIKTADFKTVSMEAYDRWVEVDLKNQRTTLYTGSTPVQSFTISSGLPRTPTVTGEFKVWHKTTNQTMSGGSRAAGDYYSLPNVKWNTYFYKDYAFHTAYWHNNFGHPMSHGCVNMREAEAKILYDFAPIGTTVIVHN